MISRILSNLHTIRRLVVGVVKVLWILPSAKELSAGSNHSDVSVSLPFYLKIILPQDLGKTTAVFKTFGPKTICEKFFLFQKQFNSQIVFGTIEQKHLLSLRKFCKQNDVTIESVSLVHAEIISRWNNWKCSCTTHTHTHRDCANWNWMLHTQFWRRLFASFIMRNVNGFACCPRFVRQQLDSSHNISKRESKWSDLFLKNTKYAW